MDEVLFRSLTCFGPNVRLEFYTCYILVINILAGESSELYAYISEAFTFLLICMMHSTKNF